MNKRSAEDRRAGLARARELLSRYQAGDREPLLAWLLDEDVEELRRVVGTHTP